MENKLIAEMFCNECNHEWEEAEENERRYVCPKCGSHSVYRSHYLICDCGATVWLDSFTNECEGCGKLYNGFGQKLRNPSEWEENY